VFSIAVRLIWINQPYIDNWSWRQSDVAAIARNFYTKGFHFDRPQIDWAGDQPGYVGTEFPVLPFLIAVCYKFCGVHDWMGRAESVILFAFSLPFFFRLIRDVFGELPAIWALFFYSFAPLGIFTSRAFMPDMPSLSLAIIGLYFFIRWIESEPNWQLRSASFFASAACISLSILIKAPSAIIGAPLACLAWQKRRWRSFLLPKLWLFAAISLLPAAIWYWHAHEIALKFYPHHFFGAGGIRMMNLSWYWRIAREITNSSLTPILVALALLGLVTARALPRVVRTAAFLYWWLGAMILSIIVMGYGNRHQWYQLPLVPIAATFAGAFCGLFAEKIPVRWVKAGLSLLLAVFFAISAFVSVKPIYRSRASAGLRDLGLALKANTPSGSLIVAADNGDPTVFYYAERTGWHIPEKDGIYDGEPKPSEQAIGDLESLRQRGADYFVFNWTTMWWLDYYKGFAEYLETNATLVQATPEFKIYRLNR
jgi:4-amino-4-deoxy-L-arabinose transferase-like glycosyltransferase